MIVLTLMGWTSIPLFLKHFTHLIDGWTANGWRYGFSALMWLPVLIWAALKHKTPPNLWRAALPASLFNIGAQICFGLAPYYIDPGLMTFSLRVQIVFVTIGAVLLFPAERKTIRSWGFLTGIILVLSGTIAVLLLKPGGLGKGSATGIMLALGSGFLYAFGKDHGTVVFTMEPKQIVLLLLSAIIGIGIGHTLYYASINRLGLAVSAGVVQLQPITVSIGSMLIFNEQLSTIQWIFGIIAVCGAGLILWTQGRKKT
jgi:drug/metabolite transporter (DMT)-like permease